MSTSGAHAPIDPANLEVDIDDDNNDDDDDDGREITVEDEGDLGATIPETPLFDDLTSTVPNLPHAPRPPQFGFPATPAAAPAPAPATPAPAPAAAPVFGFPAAEPVAAAAPAQAKPPPTEDMPAIPDEPDPGPSPYGPGAIIGDKYRLLHIIGRGGMGAVWIAHNTALDVEVAIKLMRRDRATPEAAARFTTEARAAARLGHPSIVRVFDFGETSRGDPFIVMELLRGESFGALLARKKKLKPTVAVQTLLPVGHALAAAHAKGIVHRDLKPDNILLAKDESGVLTPKVVDFGIAKLVSSDVERHFTIAGEVLGSPDYMSPEQARGQDDIDHRTDIWTFTVLLYEAVAGRRPFEATNYNALLASIIATKPVPISELGAADATLSSIIEKGLAKERDERWQSVREMAMELAKWAIDQGVAHDLVGTSLSAQWLEPTRKRLFTSGGSAPPPPPETVTGAGPEPAIPKPPLLGALASEVSKPAPAISTSMPPFAPRRGPLTILAVLVSLALIVGVTIYGLTSGHFFDSEPRPAVSGTERTGAVEPPVAPTVEPSATVSGDSGASSAKPVNSAKTRPTGTGFRPKAPTVKGPINF